MRPTRNKNTEIVTAIKSQLQDGLHDKEDSDRTPSLHRIEEESVSRSNKKCSHNRRDSIGSKERDLKQLARITKGQELIIRDLKRQLARIDAGESYVSILICTQQRSSPNS